MGKKGIWVDYGEEIDFIPQNAIDILYFDGKAVTLEGIFVFESDMGHGHLGLNSGLLSNTDRIIENKRYYDGSIEFKR